MYLFAFLTTFFLVVGKFCSASTSCRVRANRFLNRQLVGHVIATHQSLDAEDCMEQCVENQQCYSTNFHLDSRQCELNDRTRLSHPLHLIRASHVIHEDNPARDYVPCSDALCNKLEVCHVTKGRPKCSVCDAALGLETGLLSNSAFSASSIWGSGHEPFRARLNHVPQPPHDWSVDAGSWSSSRNEVGEWLQVDLGETKLVTKVATQGRALLDQWVTSYKIAFSTDAVAWETFRERQTDTVFPANSDRNTPVTHVLYPHPRARYVRIVVQTWHEHISLRAELYGCSEVEVV